MFDNITSVLTSLLILTYPVAQQRPDWISPMHHPPHSNLLTLTETVDAPYLVAQGPYSGGRMPAACIVLTMCFRVDRLLKIATVELVR